MSESKCPVTNGSKCPMDTKSECPMKNCPYMKSLKLEDIKKCPYLKGVECPALNDKKSE